MALAMRGAFWTLPAVAARQALLHHSSAMSMLPSGATGINTQKVSQRKMRVLAALCLERAPRESGKAASRAIESPHLLRPCPVLASR
jgi:hypothetical protein